MALASARDESEAARAAERGEGRVTALARNLIETVGVEGAIRYCSSVGWRGVLREVELLGRQDAPAE